MLRAERGVAVASDGRDVALRCDAAQTVVARVGNVQDTLRVDRQAVGRVKRRRVALAVELLRRAAAREDVDRAVGKHLASECEW